jgi:cadmium resistance protein CadD (predicted permease)
MDTAAAYGISVGMIVLGVWLVYTAAMASAPLLVWTLIGLIPVTVGLISLFSEIRSDEAEQ